MPILPKGPVTGPLVIIPLAGDTGICLDTLLSRLLASGGPGPKPCVLLVPEQEEDMPGIADLFGETIPVGQATHGSAIEPGTVLVLPVGRHFVLEDGRLELRPPVTSGHANRLERFVGSLGAASGFAILIVAEGRAALGPDAQAAFLQAGGRILAPDDLGPASLAREPRLAPRSAIHEATLAHEVRQPLQTLVLLQSLLKRQLQDPRQLAIVDRMGETLTQLASILTAPPPAGQRSLALRSESSGEDVVPDPAGSPMLVHVIDDDASIREAVRAVLEAEGSTVRDYGRCEQFLEAYAGETEGCLLVDAYLPGMSGLDLLEEMGRRGHPMPTIVMTGSSDVRMAVSAMKMGATDFLEKPVTGPALVACVRAALSRARNADADHMNREKAMQALKGLTRRQRQIMTMVLDGHPSKNIAADLGISQRTVENHRAAIMRRTGSRSLPQLARLILALPSLEIE